MGLNETCCWLTEHAERPQISQQFPTNMSHTMRFSIAIFVVAACCGCDDEEQPTPASTNVQAESSQENSEVVAPKEAAENDEGWEAQEETQFETENLTVLAGDLIEAQTPSGEMVKMALYGIAAPKAGQPMHEQSKAGLSHRLKDQTVTVRIRRIKGDTIMVDLKVPPQKASTGGPHGHNLPPKFVNGDLVRFGLAWHDSNEVPDSRSMADRQESAKEKRRGLWGETKAPIPPWKWKPASDDSQ